MDKPFISIIIPCYKQAAYLEQAVTSVYSQDWPVEVIVVNDGSPDQTDEVVGKLLKKYPEIIYLKQENSGVCKAVNFGFTRVTSDYTLRLDADDYLPENYLGALYQSLTKAPEWVAYAYCDAHYFGAKEGVFPAAPYNLKRLLFDNYIHVSALCKTEALKAVGYVNEKMIYSTEDWELWVALADAGFSGVYCRETFLNYRKKEEEGRSEASDQKHRAMWDLLHLEHPNLYGTPLGRWRLFVWRVRRKLGLLPKN